MTRRRPATPEETAELARRQRHLWIAMPLMIISALLIRRLPLALGTRSSLTVLAVMAIIAVAFRWVRSAAPETDWWRDRRGVRRRR